jgi:hypothetical protein
MACITDGTLRAQLDGELSEAGQLEVRRHCDSCADCRRRAEAIARSTERVRGVLSSLSPVEQETPSDARAAFLRFQASRAAFQREGPSLVASLFAKRLAPAWVSLAVVCLIAGALAFAPARSWAQRILGLLRVQKITVVPIDFGVLDDPSSRAQLAKTFSQLISDDVVFTVRPSEPEPVESREEAERIVGFKVRLLHKTGLTPELKVLGEQAFHLTIDRDRLQTILDEAGRSDLQLPFALDGATITARIPKLAFVQYGHCSRRNPEAAAQTDCIRFVQAPSPMVSIPPELNMAELAEVVLQFGGMKPEAARQFSRSIDWTTTLVVGIPRGTSARAVEVDSVEGTLIEEPGWGERRPSVHKLFWVKNGTIYALFVWGDSVDALTLAESLN